MLLVDGCPLPQVQFASLSVLVQLSHDGGGRSDHRPPTILSKVSSEEIEHGASSGTGPPGTGIETVECRTEDGGTKMVPLYPKGAAIYYRNASSGGTRTPATILDVHSDDFLEPYYTVRLDDGREKQTDNAHLRLGASSAEDSDGAGNPLRGGAAEADRSAGPPAPRTPSRAVLVESMTVVSPLTTLPEGACERGLDGIRRVVMEDLGMRDDFIVVGSGPDHPGGEPGGNSGVDPSSDPRCEPEVDGGEVVVAGDGGAERPGDDCRDSAPRGRVRFHDDTKEGAAQDPPPEATARPSSEPDQNRLLGSTVTVKVYRPPPCLLNFPIGITIFYAVAHVEDPLKFAKPDGNGADDGMARALRNCASVLLPGIELSSLDEVDTCRESGGAVVLAVGVSGPAYDLFGASAAFATMPERLREGMVALAAVDTSPRAMAPPHGVVAVGDDQPSASEGKKKKSKAGRKGSHNKLPASLAAPSQPSMITQQPASHDASYFRRLYEALLATLMDDEDGMMRDHDDVPLATSYSADDRVPQSYDPKLISSSTKAVVGVAPFMAPQRPGPTESPSGLLAGQSVTSSGTVKKKLFTFSRGRRSSKSKAGRGEYESGVSISGGDGPLGGGGAAGNGLWSDNVEAVRRTAQRLELLSLVEDDMALPKYTRAEDDKKGGGRRPSSSAVGKSLSARSKAGGHGAGSAPGRFGRPAAPSDLWGFDCRHPSQRPQHRAHGGASASGTASTSIMGASASDDVVSVMSGDDSVTVGSKFTVGSASHSSVPTLSKSKRDSSSGGASSRSRFLRRKRREGKPGASGPATKGGSSNEEEVRRQAQAANAEAKPPLFPQQPLQTQQAQQQQPVYDPFSMEDVDVDSYNVEEDSKTEGSESQSAALVSTRESARTPSSAKTPQDSQAPGTLMNASTASAVSAQEKVVRNPQTPADPEEEEGRLAPISTSPQRPDPSPAPSPTTVVRKVTGPQAIQAFATAPVSLPSSHRQAIANNVVRSYSHESGGVDTDGAPSHEESAALSVATAESMAQSVASISIEDVRSVDASPVPESPGSIKTEPESGATAASADERTEAEITRYLDVGLALNEDLTCEYRKSKLSTLTVEGTVQVRVNTRYDGEPAKDQQGRMVPFLLVFRDYAGHIKALQENKKFVENVTRGDVANREFTYTVGVPREDEYFPVVRYKCGSSLRPVPIRVQSRVRTQNKFCRVALQISSNPQNASDLVHLTIIMSVPDGVRGDTLQTNPPGGVWNESKRVVLWCVSELGGGEKFQLQSVFEMGEELLQERSGRGSSGDVIAEELEFPVLARCQCSGAQLSDVALEVTEAGDVFPAEVTKSLVQRFRVSHKESNL